MPREFWSTWEIKLLGALHDEEVARVTGRDQSAVRAKRVKLGVPLLEPKHRPWTPEEDKLVGKPVHSTRRDWTIQELRVLGTAPDREIAGRLGRSIASVQLKRSHDGVAMLNPAHRRWTEREIALLGTLPDQEVARRLGRTLRTVAAKRKEMGVPYRNPRYRPWRAKEVRLLGKKSDDEAARLTGRTLSAVLNKRKALGIPITSP